MQLNSFTFYIHGSVKSIFEDTWGIIKPHIAYMSFVWAIFYIPANIFVLLRSGDMVRHMNSGSTAVIPVMLLLSLIGTIPNLVIVLLVRDRDCEDCSSLVGLALRKLPLYITTTLAMFFRVLPFSLLALIASLGLSIGLETIGMEPGFVLISSGVLIAVIVLYGVMVYSLSVPFYLMRDIPNFRAARFSRVIFKMNYKIVAPAFGVCILFPFLGNMAMLFFLENEAANILLGFLAGYYMFLASGFFAGLFNHLFERPENEELPAENNHEIE